MVILSSRVTSTVIIIGERVQGLGGLDFRQRDMTISSSAAAAAGNVFLSRPQLPYFSRPPLLAQFPSFSSSKWQRIHNMRTASISCSSGYYEHERVVCPRPEEVPWRKELANTVHLIGVTGAPVQIKHLSSGKVVAWTRLGVKKSATDTTWISLTLWDELAHVAFQHVEKGQQIYVCGRLVSDSVEGEEEKQKVYYKVVVQQLNFIERTLPTVSLYNSDVNTMTKWPKPGTNTGGSIEDLWKAFFSNPLEWWDNRKDKRNPKYPDFKHKETGEALWIEGKYNPPWVKSQLAMLDSRLGSVSASNSSSTDSFLYNDDFTTFQ